MEDLDPPARDREERRGDSGPEHATRRVVRRPKQLSREQRALIERYRADMPPHHDSSWG